MLLQCYTFINASIITSSITVGSLSIMQYTKSLDTIHQPISREDNPLHYRLQDKETRKKKSITCFSSNDTFFQSLASRKQRKAINYKTQQHRGVNPEPNSLNGAQSSNMCKST